ncbi:MAG TPA: hypothetical protein VEH58_07480 [Dehalococcoidales bacterium]|nr:hypothetical protein [Dehalococcoidales bacterium]
MAICGENNKMMAAKIIAGGFRCGQVDTHQITLYHSQERCVKKSGLF